MKSKTIASSMIGLAMVAGTSAPLIPVASVPCAYEYQTTILNTPSGQLQPGYYISMSKGYQTVATTTTSTTTFSGLVTTKMPPPSSILATTSGIESFAVCNNQTVSLPNSDYAELAQPHASVPVYTASTSLIQIML